MKRAGKEQVRADISEAFDFVRFLIKHPETLKKIRSGSDIRMVPTGAKAPDTSRLGRKLRSRERRRQAGPPIEDTSLANMRVLDTPLSSADSSTVLPLARPLDELRLEERAEARRP